MTVNPGYIDDLMLDDLYAPIAGKIDMLSVAVHPDKNLMTIMSRAKKIIRKFLGDLRNSQDPMFAGKLYGRCWCSFDIVLVWRSQFFTRPFE